jgi:hypothetical protein
LRFAAVFGASTPPTCVAISWRPESAKDWRQLIAQAW